MKGNFRRRVGPAPPILAVVALLLTIGVVATTPLAYAKYAHSATVTASARVALWDLEITQAPSTTGIGFVSGAAQSPGLTNQVVKIKNNSEVMAEVRIEVRGGSNGGVYTSVPAVTAASPVVAAGTGSFVGISASGASPGTGAQKYKINPKAEATFTFNFQGTGAPMTDHYSIWFEAEQVD